MDLRYATVCNNGNLLPRIENCFIRDDIGMLCGSMAVTMQ